MAVEMLAMTYILRLDCPTCVHLLQVFNVGSAWQAAAMLHAVPEPHGVIEYMQQTAASPG